MRAYYETIAKAEDAILSAGFKRDISRSMWVDNSGRAVKVMRDPVNGFYVDWP